MLHVYIHIYIEVCARIYIVTPFQSNTGAYDNHENQLNPDQHCGSSLGNGRGLIQSTKRVSCLHICSLTQTYSGLT